MESISGNEIILFHNGIWFTKEFIEHLKEFRVYAEGKFFGYDSKTMEQPFTGK